MLVGYGLIVCFVLLCWSVGGEGRKVAAARQQQCDAAIRYTQQPWRGESVR